MSKYYNINDLKVRVSDHEPNYAMDRFRGSNDVVFYTKSPDNRTLSVIDQVGHYCEAHDLDVSLFSEVVADFPDPELTPVRTLESVSVSQSFINDYRAISGKGATKKKERLCTAHGYDAYLISQGRYTIDK